MGKQLIKEVPTSSLPREHIEIYGAEALSDQELLAILLHTGQHPYSMMSIAGNLLETFGGLASLQQTTLHELGEIRRTGRVKVIEIKALVELDQRVQTDHEKVAPPVRTNYELAQQLILETRDHKQEHLVCICLDTRSQVVLKRTVFIGSLNQSVAHPREISHYTARYCAARIVLVHNHPFGSAIPSQRGMNSTKRVQKCREIMEITVLDHLIIGRKQYFSLRKEGAVEGK